jgi:amino-acid N-acetyltransferase
MISAALREATANDHAQITALLAQARLPTDGLAPADLQHFVVALDAGHVIGAAGLEQYGPHGLLRSLVVSPDWRGHGLGAALVDAIENRARAQGLRSLNLLTQTAAPFFGARGYAAIERQRAPAAVQQSTEFTTLCPVSSICMYKTLT